MGLRYDLAEEGPCKFSSEKQACSAVVFGRVNFRGNKKRI